MDPIVIYVQSVAVQGTHRPEGSHEVRTGDMQGTLPHRLQSSPHALPAHGSGVQVTVPGRQAPVRSQWPRKTGSMHGGVAFVQGGSTVHSAPQVFPSHGPGCGGGGDGHVNDPAATHSPPGSHAFTTAVSTHFGSPGAHTVQGAAQLFPSQGS
jgi:hypothetical protein